MYQVKLPKILCLALVISKYAKNVKYFNTNNLINIANTKKKELVRLRKDKNSYEYKYFEDTNFGGLRGNFSTVLTLCGLVKKNNLITAFYSIGPGERLINAVNKGDILLDKDDFIASTNSLELKLLLENEAKYLSLRENQAHIKTFLSKNSNFPLKRDDTNFKKMCVLKSTNNQYYYRVLFNTYLKPNIIQFNMLSYLQGPKIKKQNIHALFVIPSSDNDWNEFLVIDLKDIIAKAPLFICFDTTKRKFYDSENNEYPFSTLNDSLLTSSNENGNSAERLNYDHKKALDNIVSKKVGSTSTRTETEESEFIKCFLNNSLNNLILIKGKKAKEYKIHKAGVDVTIEFMDGTSQGLELEHKWSHYISHGHQNNVAWNGSWIYANEKFDWTNIKNIFKPYKGSYIPSIFLSSDPSTGDIKAFEVDWTNDSYAELPISF